MAIEIELEHEGQAIARPRWLGREITSDGRYSNSRLSLIPYRTFAAEGLQECMP